MNDSYGTYDGSRPEPPYECPECVALRAKLQAAEESIEKKEAEIQQRLHELGLTYKVQMDLTSRAEAAEARIVELETAVLNWYEWSTNDSNNDAPLDTINEIALLMLDQEPKVNP